MSKLRLKQQFCGVLGDFGPFWVKLGSVTSKIGVKILKFRNSDITIGFLTPKNVPLPNLRLRRLAVDDIYELQTWLLIKNVCIFKNPE